MPNTGKVTGGIHFAMVSHKLRECMDRGNTFRIAKNDRGGYTLTKHGDHNQLIFRQWYESVEAAKQAAIDRRFEWKSS